MYVHIYIYIHIYVYLNFQDSPTILKRAYLREPSRGPRRQRCSRAGRPREGHQRHLDVCCRFRFVCQIYAPRAGRPRAGHQRHGGPHRALAEGRIPDTCVHIHVCVYIYIYMYIHIYIYRERERHNTQTHVMGIQHTSTHQTCTWFTLVAHSLKVDVHVCLSRAEAASAAE